MRTLIDQEISIDPKLPRSQQDSIPLFDSAKKKWRIAQAREQKIMSDKATEYSTLIAIQNELFLNAMRKLSQDNVKGKC